MSFLWNWGQYRTSPPQTPGSSMHGGNVFKPAEAAEEGEGEEEENAKEPAIVPPKALTRAHRATKKTIQRPPCRKYLPILLQRAVQTGCGGDGPRSCVHVRRRKLHIIVHVGLGRYALLAHPIAGRLASRGQCVWQGAGIAEPVAGRLSARGQCVSQDAGQLFARHDRVNRTCGRGKGFGQQQRLSCARRHQQLARPTRPAPRYTTTRDLNNLPCTSSRLLLPCCLQRAPRERMSHTQPLVEPLAIEHVRQGGTRLRVRAFYIAIDD